MKKGILLIAFLAITSTAHGATNPVFTVNDVTPGAVNGIQITGAISGSTPIIASSGLDTNVGMILTTQGLGVVSVGTSSAGSELNVYGGVSIGTSYVGTASPLNGLIVQGNVGIGTTVPDALLSLSGQAAQVIDMVRELTASTAGNNLTLKAGGAVVLGTDLPGGNLILSSGISTGTSTSNIQFQAYPAALSTGTSDNTSTTILTVSGTGSASGGTGSFGNLATTLQSTIGIGTDENGGNLTLASGVSTGTGTSSMNFQVYGAGTSSSTANNPTTAITIASTGNVGIGTATIANAFEVNGAAGIGYTGIIAPSNGMIIKGNVGIGTMAPLYQLDIRNSSEIGQMHLSGTGNDEGGYILGFSTNQLLLAGGTEYNGTNWVAKDTAASTVGIANGGIDVYADSGLTKGSPFTPTPRMKITPSGNVGIGTSIPVNKLTVVGDGNGVAQIGSAGCGGNYVALTLGQTTTTSGCNNYNILSAPSQPLFINRPTGANIQFRENNSDQMIIASGGTVGIGTLSPRGGSILDVNGKLYVATFASGSSTTVCQNANILSSCTSARRFKENIKPSELGLTEILAMKPVTFDLRNHKDNWERRDFGFIAEDMEKINPLFVTYDEKGEINGVRYTQLTAVNAKAIQELHAVISKQQDEIDELKRMVEKLTHQQ